MQQHLPFILLSVLCLSTAAADESAALRTLRDNAVLTGPSPQPTIHKALDSGPVPRNYPTQPPVIPHTTKGYVINQKFNKCLTCHSDQNAETSGATPVSGTHYLNREGAMTDKIAGRRYFCVQCHVPQNSAEPLAGNGFKPEEAAQ